jgi:hypothetical protein
MGILQKLFIHKIDPNNVEWKQRQIDRVNRAIDDWSCWMIWMQRKSIKEFKGSNKKTLKLL